MGGGRNQMLVLGSKAPVFSRTGTTQLINVPLSLLSTPRHSFLSSLLFALRPSLSTLLASPPFCATLPSWSYRFVSFHFFAFLPSPLFSLRCSVSFLALSINFPFVHFLPLLRFPLVAIVFSSSNPFPFQSACFLTHALHRTPCPSATLLSKVAGRIQL